MTILEVESLAFARRHLQRFDHSDFFPPMEEYDAIWADWDNFSASLVSQNIANLPLAAASAMPVAKGRVGYRIVHQLDPLTNIAYTALAYGVAPFLEAQRADPDTACSHRFAPTDGAFFGEGQGYGRYRERSEGLAGWYSFGAAVDVADFYNQIYSHRVRGSIEAAAPEWHGIAQDVERVIHAMNSRASKGIPVGCDASAVLAEGILIDVDQLISRRGIEHTRYVDDIRMFSDSEQALQGMIEELSEYLYDNHRLHLNSSKTRLLPSGDFVSRVIHDHFDTEVEAAMNLLGQMDPYGTDGLSEDDVPNEAILQQIGPLIVDQYASNGHVDLNLVKAYIRRAREARSASFVQTAIDATEAFVPAIHELSRAMDNLVQIGSVDAITPLVAHIRSTPFYQRKAVRYWLDWLCAGSRTLLENAQIRASVFASDLRIQARAANTSGDLAWIRSQRGGFIHMPPLQRSATMLSMRLLGRDERRHLLDQVPGNASPLDLAVKRFVLAS